MLWNHQHGRWFDFVWLIYSVFFFFQPIQENTMRGWIRFAILYGLFLLCYAGVVRARARRQAHLFMVAMAILGFAWYPSNGGAAGAIIYVAAFAPFVVESLAACLAIFAIVDLGLVAEGLFFHMPFWSWAIMVFMCLAVGAGNLFAAQRMRADQKLGLAREEIEHLAKVAERERIARDLHDVLGHTLSVVVLKSELAGKLIQHNPDRARTEIGEVEQIARTALAEVREAIRGYRSEGLVAEIERARATLDAAGVTLECSSAPPKMLPAEETVMSLVLREAVTNIVRHAHASLCRITFQDAAAERSLTIEDDGRGGIGHEGSGLRGMRERVQSLGGSLCVECAGSTRLTIQIPNRQDPT
ncbi:MAG: sensor histidine kinase [Acidobacteriota bacterium]